jgi:hypothetical protein
MWWRLRLSSGPDGYLMVQRTDNAENPTWWSIEFFDGEDTLVDAGLDRPAVDEVRIISRYDDDLNCGDPWRTISMVTHVRIHLDVLAVAPPTPSPRWRPITMPGDHQHPGDEVFGPSYCSHPLPEREPRCTPSRHEQQFHRARI